jgi:hypothetical protein
MLIAASADGEYHPACHDLEQMRADVLAQTAHSLHHSDGGALSESVGTEHF